MIEYSRYDSPISPTSFMSILNKRKKLIITLFVLVFTSIIAASFVLPPVYRSTAKLMVNYQGEDEKSYMLGMVSSGNRAQYDRIGSELAIVKMHSILEPVVKELEMDKPEEKDFSLLSTLGLGNEAIADENPEMLHNQAVVQLSKDLNVEREKDTNVLVLTYDADDPQYAANVVKQVVSEYIDQRPLLDRDDRDYEFYNKQITDIEERIAQLEQQGMQYRSYERLLQPDEQTKILVTSAADFDKELTKTRSERISKEARLEVIREQLASGTQAITFPNMESSEKVGRMDYLNELKKTKLELELEKSAMAKKYTDKHPEMVRVTQAIESTNIKIQAEINEFIRAEETSVRALRATEQALAGKMNQVVNSVVDLSRQEYELGKLTIGIEDLREVHSMLIRKREEARIAASKQEYNVKVRVLEPAMTAPHPVKPNKALFAGLAVVLGIMISLGGAFFIEMFDHSVNTVEDAQHCLGLPILAAIPDFDSRRLGDTMQCLQAPRYSMNEMATVD